MTVFVEQPGRAPAPQRPAQRSVVRPAQRPVVRSSDREAPSRQIRPRSRSVVRPAGARPAIVPLPYRGYRVAVSRAVHPRRRVSTASTVGLAGVSALIVLWLGFVAQFSGGHAAAPAQLPERLAVVQVQAGETLQHLAARVAPGVPAAAVVERIRSLNELDSAALDVGQTLIAPIA